MEPGNEAVRVPFDANGLKQRIAVSTTAAKTALVAGLASRRGWLRFIASGADVEFFLTTSDVGTAVVYQSTTDANVGVTVFAGTFQDYYVHVNTMTHISWDASAAGFLTIVAAGEE